MYTKNAKKKQNWNWRNNRLFVTFLATVAFQLGGPEPLAMLMLTDKEVKMPQIFMLLLSQYDIEKASTKQTI